MEGVDEPVVKTSTITEVTGNDDVIDSLCVSLSRPLLTAIHLSILTSSVLMAVLPGELGSVKVSQFFLDLVQTEPLWINGTGFLLGPMPFV